MICEFAPTRSNVTSAPGPLVTEAVQAAAGIQIDSLPAKRTNTLFPRTFPPYLFKLMAYFVDGVVWFKAS